MGYADELRALYAQAGEGIKRDLIQQGDIARGQATRRAAATGRYNQPVQEWSYSEIERNLANALSTGLGGLARDEANALMGARRLDIEAKQQKKSNRAATLQSIFGLAGTIAGGPIGGAAGTGLVGLLSKKKKKSDLITPTMSGGSVNNYLA